MDNLCLYPSRLSNWSEKGARQRASATQEELDAVDWKALKSHSQKIKRYIRVKISVATLNSMPIMPDAYAKFCNEEFFLWNWGEIIRKESIKIQLKLKRPPATLERENKRSRRPSGGGFYNLTRMGIFLEELVLFRHFDFGADIALNA